MMKNALRWLETSPLPSHRRYISCSYPQNTQPQACPTYHAFTPTLQAFTLRDRQLENKAQAAAHERTYQSEMDQRMVVAWRLETDREKLEQAQLAIAKQQAREALAAQMKARKHQQLLAEEAREQEGMALLAQLQVYKEEDAKALREKRAQMTQLRQDVIRANAEAVHARREAQEQEKAEMNQLVAYQQRKDAELRAREKVEAVRAHAKKVWQAQLFAQQERAQTNEAEVEERRTRRAAQQKERAARLHEEQEALRRKQEAMVLKDDLLRQAAAKKTQALADAVAERDELEACQRRAAEMLARERAEQAHKASLNKAHLRYLKQQVLEAEARQRASRTNKFEEGRRLKQEAAAEVANLEAIRNRLIADLEAKGVAPKYLTHMRRQKLGPAAS